jgi:hypothetical protein
MEEVFVQDHLPSHSIMVLILKYHEAKYLICKGLLSLR